ncbi:MAG: helix-turn-helix domain-containing protein [Sinobacteraceae bacterium]|nr:helix-turn-helix domain-containing protein [Nevskiaceae bacterium]
MNTEAAGNPVERLERLSYRPAEAADALGVGKSKVYELIKAGELELVKLGRHTSLIPASSLHALLKRLREEAKHR